MPLTQNGNLAKPEEKTNTAEKLAVEKGCGKNTVIRAEKYADAVDTLSEIISPEVKQGGTQNLYSLWLHNRLFPLLLAVPY
ncbi:MAG: hypothetical protein HQK62_07495 [Desulfamplus sp.]|nr:hypothetical protein [Desulfamplus sp.]